MESTLTNKLTSLLKAADSLQAEYEADSFAPEVIEARGSITAAEAMIAEAAKEPDSLTPAEIIALRTDGTNALEAARITLRRAEAKREQHGELLFEKLHELKEDTLAAVDETVSAFEAKIRDAVIELSDGYFSEHEKGHTVPVAIARHRSRGLNNHKSYVDGRRFGSVTSEVKIQQIRTALECAKQHLS
ncbi:MAG: hypothetical protein Q8Q59_07725 [Luteolibacter sp.]|jgi:hypothetical protein|nr:hypothetical protein [Luteolibacter sp.]